MTTSQTQKPFDATQMIKRAIDVMLRPQSVWPQVAQEEGGLKEAFLPYTLVIGLAPMLIGAFMSSTLWGALAFIGGAGSHMLMSTVLFGSVFGYLYSMIGILVLSKIVELAAPSFGLRQDWTLTARVLVYAATPTFLAGLVNWVPLIGFMGSSLAFVWGLVLAYQGLNAVLQPKAVSPETPSAPKVEPVQREMAGAARVIIVGLLSLGLLHPAQAKELPGPKKRIAVTEFKDKSDHSSHYWANVGEGMSEMLTTALNKTGKFIMVERNQLSEARDEQALAKEGAVQSATGAKSGQLIGAAYLVTGAVTEFGIKDSKFGAGNLERVLPIGGGASLQTETARVALDLRFFDTTTGQLIATEQAVGTKTSRKVSSDINQMPTIEFGKEGFDDTIIGQATREAVDKAVLLVEKHMESTPWYGRIVKVESNEVFLNTGEEDGRKLGDQFQVIRAGETMLDPDTGESLGAQNTVQGQVRIVSVIGKRLSKAEIVTGQDIRSGDIINNTSQEPRS